MRNLSFKNIKKPLCVKLFKYSIFKQSKIDDVLNTAATADSQIQTNATAVLSEVYLSADRGNGFIYNYWHFKL